MEFPRTNRMTTGIERVFRKTFDGLYRELYLHFIHFLDDNGNVVASKLDKTIQGPLYKIATGNERSSYGEVEYKFPDAEVPVRLIQLACDRNDTRYGRFSFYLIKLNHKIFIKNILEILMAIKKLSGKQLVEAIRNAVYDVLEEELDVRLNKINEKWNKNVEVEKTGEWSDYTVAELKKKLNTLKKKENKTEADKKKEHQIVFAIRAKGGWKKGEGATK